MFPLVSKIRKCDLAVRTAEGSIRLATGDQNLKMQILLF